MVAARWVWATPDGPGENLDEQEPTSVIKVCIADATGWRWAIVLPRSA